MSRECCSALMLHPFDIPHISPLEHTYYRSRLFTHHSTTNPLLAAANPLFSILERFSSTLHLPPIHQVRTNLEHEWQAFRSQLSRLKYLHECSVVAEYLMSSTLDELLGKTYLRIAGQPVEFIAFTPSSARDPAVQSHFFELIQHMKERANQYLDLLELAYYCLVSGYEGEFHLKADGRQTLDNLIQELYELILLHRTHQPIQLFNDSPPAIHSNKKPPRAAFPWQATLLAVLAILTLYWLGQHKLEQQVKQLIHEHTQPIARDTRA